MTHLIDKESETVDDEVSCMRVPHPNTPIMGVM